MFFKIFKIPYVFFLLIFSTFGLIQDDLKKKLQQMLEAKLSSYENIEDFQCKPFIDFEFSLPHGFKMDLIPDTLTKKLENMLTTVNSDVRKHVSFTINVRMKNNGFNYIQSIRIHFELTDDAFKCLEKWKRKCLKMNTEDSHLWCIKTIGWHVKRTGILRKLGKFELSIIDMKNKKWRQTLNYLFGKAKYELEADQKNPTNILINLIPPKELNPEDFLVMLQHVHESVRPKFKGVQSIKYLVQPIMHGNKIRYLDMIIFGTTLNETEEVTKKSLDTKCNKHLISHLHQEYKTLSFECASVFNAVEVDKAKTTENWYRLVVRVRNRKPGHNLDSKTISKIVHETGIGNNEKLSFESSYNGFDYADQKKDYLILTFKEEELTTTVNSVTTQGSPESTTPISSPFTELMGRARATYKKVWVDVTTPKSKNETESIIATSQSFETTQGFSDDATSILPPITDPEQKTETTEQVLFSTDVTTPKSFQESKTIVAPSLISKNPESSEDFVTSTPPPSKDLGQSCLCLGRKADSPEQVLSSTDGLQESKATIATSLSYKTSESSGESGTSILPHIKDIGQKTDSFTQILSSANVTWLKSVQEREATIATPPIPITSSILSAESVQESVKTTPTLPTTSENGPGFSTLILSSFEDTGRKADLPKRIPPSVEKVSLEITTSQSSKSTGVSSDSTTLTLLPIKDPGQHTDSSTQVSSVSTESAKETEFPAYTFSPVDIFSTQSAEKSSVEIPSSPSSLNSEDFPSYGKSNASPIEDTEQRIYFSTHASSVEVFSTQSAEISLVEISTSPSPITPEGFSSSVESVTSTIEDTEQRKYFSTHTLSSTDVFSTQSKEEMLAEITTSPRSITSEGFPGSEASILSTNKDLWLKTDFPMYVSSSLDVESSKSKQENEATITSSPTSLISESSSDSTSSNSTENPAQNTSFPTVISFLTVFTSLESAPASITSESTSDEIGAEHIDSNLYIQKIIALEMIPLLFGKYPTSELTFRIQKQPSNYNICGVNSIWKIILKFESEEDGGPYVSSFEEILNDIFERHSNISRIKYIFDFTKKRIQRDLVDVYLCFNKTKEPDIKKTIESDFSKTKEPDFNKTTEPDFNKSREPYFNESIEPDFNKTIKPSDFNNTIKPDFRKLIEPDSKKTMEPLFRNLIESDFNMTIEPDFNKSIEKNFNETIEPSFRKLIEPDFNNTREPDFNKTTIEPDFDKTTEPDVRKFKEPDFNKTMEPFFRKLIEPDFNMTIEPDFRTTDFDGSVESNCNKSIKPDSNNAIESDFKKKIEPDFNKTIIKPDFDKTIEPDFRKLIKPDFNKTMEPFFRKLIEPDFNMTIEPDFRTTDLDGSVEPNFNKSIKPDSNNTIESDFKKKIEPDFNKTIIKPDFDKTIEPDFRKLIEPDFNKTMEPFFRKLIEPDFNMTIETDFRRTDFDGSVEPNFNKSIKPDSNNTIESDFNKKLEPDFKREDFIQGILDTEIFPYADGFDPLHKPVTRILQKEEMVTDECKSDIFEVEVTDLGGGTCFSTMRMELLLLNLLEKYPQLRGSCLPLDSGFGYNNTLKICMKVASRPKTCTMPKTTEMECCGWKDEATSVIPPGGWPPLQNGSTPVIKGGAPPVGLTHKPYPKELKKKWLNNIHQIRAFMKNKGG